jgi:hypothetical protein
VRTEVSKALHELHLFFPLNIRIPFKNLKKRFTVKTTTSAALEFELRASHLYAGTLIA